MLYIKGGGISSSLTCVASLFLDRLLKHIRWNNATFSDCVSRETLWRKLCGQLNWLFPILLPPKPACVSASLKYYSGDMLLISGALCRQAMSNVSMWWWAQREWRKWSQRSGTQTEKKQQQHKDKKERILLWNPASTQGPVLKETSDKSRGIVFAKGYFKK